MRIRFIGLITHFEDSAGDGFVVLPVEASHVARLIVNTRDIDGESETSIGRRCFSLAGRISFPRVEALDRRGLAGVAKLTAIGGGTATVDPDVFTKTTNARLKAFVDLPGGRYGIEDWFPNHATFNGVHYHCMPRTVTLDTRAIGPLSVSGLGSALTLKPHATVTITNLESNLLAPGQFGIYGNVFSPPLATLQIPVEDVARPCAHGTAVANIPQCPQEPAQTAGVECSNSAYP